MRRVKQAGLVDNPNNRQPTSGYCSVRITECRAALEGQVWESCAAALAPCANDRKGPRLCKNFIF
jgi:hypothetical protein